MKVTLCGFMGCGKTTKGKALAEKLSAAFYDTDLLVERSENMSVSDIFSTRGEDYFRNCETAVIKELINSCEDMVISLGGGAVMRKENVELLRNGSTVIFIDTPIGVICDRLSGDSTRPLFNKKSAGELYEQRLPAYKQAAHFVIADDSDVGHFVQSVVDSI